VLGRRTLAVERFAGELGLKLHGTTVTRRARR
jgi:hypothetical protein